MGTRPAEMSHPAPATGLPAVPAGYARVAVVQLDYHPAALRNRSRSALEDPLFDLKRPNQDHLLPTLESPGIDAVRGDLRELRRRIREAYAAQQGRRVEAIAAACRSYGVELLVFPEYSVPYETIERLASVVPEVVIVAGAHAVDRAASTDHGYERLGAVPMPQLEQAVCPVLHGGKLLGIQPKLSAAGFEVLAPGDRWVPVDIPLRISEKRLGVLICLDFLDPDKDPYRQYAAPRLDQCDLVAVPSLTSSSSQEDFLARMRANAKLKGRPVLYCNIASCGGTTIYIDDNHDVRGRTYPDYIGRLEPGDEAVLIADIRVEPVAAGKSTRPPDRPLLCPVAAASLVYRSLTEDDSYALWIESFHDVARSASDHDVAALQRLTALVEAGEMAASAANARGIRKQRLSLLRGEMADATSTEWARLLTREIVLPPEVLPLPVLRAALAGAAADVVRSWVARTDVDLHGFAEVEARLRRVDGARSTPPLTKRGSEARDGTERAVRAGAPPARARESGLIAIEVYGRLADKALDADERAAQSEVNAGRAHVARDMYLRILADAEKALLAAPEDSAMRRRAERSRLHAAICSVNMQEIARAQEISEVIEAAPLPFHERCLLAELFAVLGKMDRAREALPRDGPSEDAEALDRRRHARQVLDLRAGTIPEDLSAHAFVQLEAAELAMERDDLAAAAAHARRVLADAKAEALLRMRALSLLIAALCRSVFEDPSNARFIPVEERGACVQGIEAGLAQHRLDDLPPAVRRNVDGWRRVYLGLVFDIDAIMAELGAAPTAPTPTEDPSPEQRDRMRAAELARSGEVQEALAVLPPVEHTWLGRYQRIEILCMAERWESALSEARELARDFPERALIEYQLAALLFRHPSPEEDTRKTHETIAHAREAYKGLPGKGQRLLLSQCLAAAGQAAEAWTLVEGYRGTDAPRSLRIVASVADHADPAGAPALWQRYTSLHPESGTAWVRYAQALFKIGRREEAAALARRVLEESPPDLQPDAILVAATLQRLKGDLDEATRDHIRRAADLLHERFPTDPHAELFRLQLLASLDEAADVTPIDVSLLSGAGWIEVVPLEQAIARIERSGATREALIAHYRTGSLPFVHLCRLMQASIAGTVDEWLEEAGIPQNPGKKEGALCTAATTEMRSPERAIQGATILLSEIELHLLHELGLLDQLQERLGEQGKLVLAKDVVERLAADEAELRMTARRDLGRADAPAKRAEAVQRYVSRGLREQWIQPVDLPEGAPALPPVRGRETVGDRNLVIAPLTELLSVRRLMEKNPSWLRLTVDFFGSGVLGYADAIQRFAWSSPEDYLRLSRYNRELAERDLHLPDLVRWLMRPPRLDDKLRRLAELGFHDALDAAALVRMARHEGGLDAPVNGNALDRMEWTTRRLDHPAGEIVRFRLAPTYAEAMVRGFFGAPASTTSMTALPPLDAIHAQHLAHALMSRAESLDARDESPAGDEQQRWRRGTVLDQLLFHVLLALGSRRRAFFRREEGKEGVFLDPSGAGRAFLDFLYVEWARHAVSRRAALGRAAQEILCALDQLRPEGGPGDDELAPLTFAMSIRRRPGGALSLEEAEIEAASILSAHWHEHAVSDMCIELRSLDGARSARITVGEILQHGAGLVRQVTGTGSESTDIGGNEQTWHYTVPLRGFPDPIEVYVPLEAVLLRMDDEARAVVAGEWAVHQGLHDGRALEMLVKLGEDPGDLALRRRYARFTVTAPWRRVRDDPMFFLQWADDRAFSTENRVPRIEDLRAMLSEPPEPLSEEGELVPVMVGRAKDDGPWGRLNLDFFLQLAAVPGLMCVTVLGMRAEESRVAEQVQAALDHLRSPDWHPIGRLACDLCFLRLVSLERSTISIREGDIDLRGLLPALTVQLLDSIRPRRPAEGPESAPPMTLAAADRLRSPAKEPASPMTLAAAEGSLLRICREMVKRIGSRTKGFRIREWMWLTHRLFLWLIAQLERVAPDDRQAAVEAFVRSAPVPRKGEAVDLLDPIHFDPTLFDHRLATVLHALLLSDELRPETIGREAIAPDLVPRLTSAALEERLLEIAQEPLRGLPDRRSTIDWLASGEVPELALMALLPRAPRSFAKLRKEARLRWIDGLARGSAGQRDAPSDFRRVFEQNLVTAISEATSALEPGEAAQFEASLRRMAKSGDAGRCRALGMTGLFGPAAPHLEEEARASLLSHVGTDIAPILAGRFLTSIAHIDAMRLETEARSLLDRIAAQGAPGERSLVLIGLARMALHGRAALRSVASDVLKRLANEAIFGDDPRVADLLRHLGLSGGST